MYRGNNIVKAKYKYKWVNKATNTGLKINKFYIGTTAHMAKLRALRFANTSKQTHRTHTCLPAANVT